MKKTEFTEFTTWYDDCINRLEKRMKKENLEKISKVYKYICAMYEKLNYEKCVFVLGSAMVDSI